MKKQEPTTQARTVDEDTLTDEEGFRTVKDYVVTVQDGVKIRRTPEEDGEVYITLDKGVDLSRTGVKEEWTRLLINGSSFYVQSKYLEETTIKWATETDVDTENHVIYIDPAKQITEDLSLEPVSPEVDIAGDIPATASGTNAERAGLKAKMTAASVGISSGIFEYDITMSVANYLNAELVKRGYTVYLSRTTNNVNLSNAKRAQMANASGAEVYIKLEAASSRDETATGELGFITTSANSHNGALYQKNYEQTQNRDYYRSLVVHTAEIKSSCQYYKRHPNPVCHFIFLSHGFTFHSSVHICTRKYRCRTSYQRMYHRHKTEQQIERKDQNQ